MTDLISRKHALRVAKNVEDGNVPVAMIVALIDAIPSAELTLQTPQAYGKSINPSNAEVVEDYISRADAIEHLKNVKASYPHADISLPIDLAIKAIEMIPSADRPTEDYSDLPDIPRAYYEKIVGNMAHEINMLNEQLESAEAVDCTDFIEWLVDKVLDETIWKNNSVAYGEIICRKLVKLGVLEATEEPSYYIRPSADAVPQLRQTDTLIIADALRYLAQDTERHELDRTRAEELREQILRYGASMCKGGDEE